MTVKPDGIDNEIDIGDETPLFTKRANTAAFKLYNLRILPIFIVCGIVIAIMILGGYWYVGLVIGVLMLAGLIVLFVPPNVPKLSYFITSQRIGMANKSFVGYYSYNDVRKVIIRRFSKTITLKGNGGLPLKIDIYLSAEDFDWFISEIVPQLSQAEIKGKK
ncbi:MAG: hypothetical protein K2M47_05395 [Clostridiales bacterium]|nr:hypothetical protein [Clostridiales bacterium]